mgnify:CR=1 FL=1
MKLNIRPDITITLDDEMAAQFSNHYYPLDNQTADIFISSMRRENQTKFNLLSNDNVPVTPELVNSIQSVISEELAHAVSLIKLPSE